MVKHAIYSDSFCRIYKNKIVEHEYHFFQEVLAAKNTEKKNLAEAVKKHKKGMKQQLEDMLNNVKRHGLDQDDDAPTGAFGDRLGGRGGAGRGGAGRGGSMRNAGELKRKLKSDKFGYGGKKKGMKRNNKER